MQVLSDLEHSRARTARAAPRVTVLALKLRARARLRATAGAVHFLLASPETLSGAKIAIIPNDSKRDVQT